MKVAIYARASTHDQKTAAQLDELRAYCERRRLEIVAEFGDVQCKRRLSGYLHQSLYFVPSSPSPWDFV
jgi:DNA invertase Pin-like site-specific DNA recombinase